MKLALLLSAAAFASSALGLTSRLPPAESAEVPSLLLGDTGLGPRIPPTSVSWGTVLDFQPELYTGRWYQVQKSAASAAIAPGIECSHADYTLLSNGTIAVENHGWNKIKGGYSGVRGIAFGEDTKKPAALTLMLFGATPFPTSYDIVSVGPVEAGQYTWAVVTDPARAQLYTLVRDYAKWQTDETFKAEVSGAVRKSGFSLPWNKPTTMKQGDGCTYQPIPPNDPPSLRGQQKGGGWPSVSVPTDLSSLDDATKFMTLFGDGKKGRRIPPTALSKFVEPNLDVLAYLGRWYQILENPVSAMAVRGKDGAVECSTADYGLLPNGTVSVVNYGQRKTDGSLTSISGIAYAEDSNKPAALAVELWGGAPFPVAYDIAKLGPIENGKYTWAIVTDPLRAGLFVLARDPSRYVNDWHFRDAIDTAVRNQGFVFPWNKPGPVKQGDGCKYAPEAGSTDDGASDGGWDIDVDNDVVVDDSDGPSAPTDYSTEPANLGWGFGGRRVPPTALSLFVEKSVDVKAYLGRWYQVAENWLSGRFTRGVECSTADYALLPNGTISVFNNGQRKADGSNTNIRGIAYAENPKKPAALAVELWGGAPFPAAYDIAKLGPIEDGKYQWAIVTDPFRANLFVLVRDYNKYLTDDDFKATITRAVKRAGFVFPWNSPRPVKQGDGCKYVPEPDDNNNGADDGSDNANLKATLLLN